MSEVTDPCHELATSFGGVAAHQWWCDYLMWEKLLNLHPDVLCLWEIGTGVGGFSLYLQTQAELRAMDFKTFDIQRPQTSQLCDNFIKGDVFEHELNAKIRSRLFYAGQPMILHCDGGNKRREVAEFAPYLMPHSLIVVHDYGTEFTGADVPDCLRIVHEDLTRGGLSCVLTTHAPCC